MFTVPFSESASFSRYLAPPPAQILMSFCHNHSCRYNYKSLNSDGISLDRTLICGNTL